MLEICIIGHTGFVGKQVFAYLSGQGHSVTGINSSTAAMPDAEFDLIINSAGNSVKYLANKDPAYDFEHNVGIFSKIIGLKSDNFIQISSIDAAGPLASNYTRSKLIAEYCAKLYFKNVSVLRLGGLVGPGLRKNVVFDILNNQDLHVTFDSRINFISTKEIGKVIENICNTKYWGKTMFVASKESISVSGIIELCKKHGLAYTGKEGGARQDYSNVDISVLEGVFAPKTSEHYINDFLIHDI